jgi:hypothetical protein
MSWVKISLRPSSEGIVSKSERMDGILVCGVLILTLIDTDGVTNIGELGTGIAGGLWQKRMRNR